MNTLTQMARTYRSMCKQVKRTDAQIRKVKAQLNELGKQRNKVIQDLEQLKTLIEYCVITGEDPTKAKLSHTVEQMHITINEHRRHTRMEDFYYTTGGSTVTTSTSTINSTISPTSLSSLVGAQGAISTNVNLAGVAHTGATGYPFVSITSQGSNLIIQDELDLLQNTQTPIP
jgi:hypothetical protein